MTREEQLAIDLRKASMELSTLSEQIRKSIYEICSSSQTVRLADEAKATVCKVNGILAQIKSETELKW